MIATTSILSNPDMDEVRKSRIVENFVPKESQIEKKDIEYQKEDLRKEIFEQRLKDIKLLPKETKEDKDEFERCKTAFIIEFNKEFGKDVDAPNFQTDEGDEDFDFFQRKLDEELLGNILQTMILCVLNLNL